ncbi:MAG TPA: 4Fe-4S dicluster domain-containing protein [Candidatus Polarisedimenticolaceae bacterium]|nr:4Fe-4S dicluster domain-containing protein [Candidatus Polarisedimenticolaceae bacterium]
MRIARRTFLKSCAAIGAAGAASALPASARETAPVPDGAGVLVDTTKCLGCRTCEAACAEANGLAAPEAMGDDAIFATHRTTSPGQFTVVNKAQGGGEDRYAKSQCLHCLVPACASACPVKALDKTEAGPVVYHEDRCIGCRYCMVACPFDVPKYQYDRAIPYVRKCTMCATRLAKGGKPACVENCPAEALTFGKRSELLAEAKRRIYAPGSTYVPEIFGEHDAGGTSWMYIADRPLSDFGLPRDVGDETRFDKTRGALGAVPFVITLWPPLLMGLYTASRRRDEENDHE